MPTRTFRIFIENVTAFPLTLVPNDGHLHGAFTPGGWTPPARIPSRERKAFQAESDGPLQGTDGHVVYQIEDGKAVPDRIRIDWNNPFWTFDCTNSTCQMQVSSGFFEDRTNGDSANFIVEGGGRRPMGESSGPTVTEGWAEIIPGLIALPIPMLGIEAHAWSMFVVRDRPAATRPPPLFGKVASDPTLSFEPIEGARSAIWADKWEIVEDKSSIKVTISRNEVSPTSIAAAFGYQTFSINIEERSTAGGSVSLSLPSIVEETVSALPYQKRVWPPRPQPIQLTPRVTQLAQIDNISPEATIPYSQPKPASHAGISVTGQQLVGAVLTGGVPLFEAAKVKAIGASLPKLELDKADGFIVENGVITLMLYTAFDNNTGQPMGFGVRYIRHYSNGKLAVDTMLLPAFRAPA